MIMRHPSGRHFRAVAFLLLLLMLAGCGRDDAAVQQTVAARAEVAAGTTLEALPTASTRPTLTARPTYTALPSDTPALTDTPASTDTPAPTLTPRPSLTPVPSDTPAPTATATATRVPATLAPTVPPTPAATFDAATVTDVLGHLQSINHWTMKSLLCSPYNCPQPYFDCGAIVSGYDQITAHRDDAPLGAAEPVNTAAGLYTSAIDVYRFELAGWYESCSAFIANGEVTIDVRRLARLSDDQVLHMQQAYRDVEEAQRIMLALEGSS